MGATAAFLSGVLFGGVLGALAMWTPRRSRRNR